MNTTKKLFGVFALIVLAFSANANAAPPHQHYNNSHNRPHHTVSPYDRGYNDGYHSEYQNLKKYERKNVFSLCKKVHDISEKLRNNNYDYNYSRMNPYDRGVRDGKNKARFNFLKSMPAERCSRFPW